MSTRSGASYTAGGSDSNSPTPPVAETEVNNDPSLLHHHRQPAPFNGVGSGAPDLAGRGDPLGPDQDTPERGQAPPPRDPGPVARAPTPLQRQDDGVERLPSPVPDAGASLLDARGAPLSGAGRAHGMAPTLLHLFNFLTTPRWEQCGIFGFARTPPPATSSPATPLQLAPHRLQQQVPPAPPGLGATRPGRPMRQVT